MWMAPNLVTLVGLVINCFGAVLFWFWDLKFARDAEIPFWVYVLSVFCLFAYQTLDAIDGKQARRTGTSSPLGQLFDHGCDAFAVIAIFAVLAHGIRTETSFYGDAFMLSGAIAFYAC